MTAPGMNLNGAQLFRLGIFKGVSLFLSLFLTFIIFDLTFSLFVV